MALPRFRSIKLYLPTREQSLAKVCFISIRFHSKILALISVDSIHIDTSNVDGTVTNSGVISVSGTSGIATSADDQWFDNENLISVTDGASLTLDVTGVNDGTISVDGTGSRIVFASGLLDGPRLSSVEIEDGGTLEVQGGALSEGVTFGSGIGTLQLDGPGFFTGTISGLVVGDVIDFADAAVTGVAVSGTTLAVTYLPGAPSRISPPPKSASGRRLSSSAAPDGSGGTEVIVSSAPLPATPLYTWNDGTSADWSVAGDWTVNGVEATSAPNAYDDAEITGTGAETVTAWSNEAVNKLALDDPNATLAVWTGWQLSVYGGLTATAIHSIDVEGTLLVGGSLTLDNFIFDLGGTLAVDPASETPAVLTLGPDLTVQSSNIGEIDIGAVAGDVIDNRGTIEGLSNLEGYALSNEGTISGDQVSVVAQRAFLNTGNFYGIHLNVVSFSDGSSIENGGEISETGSFDSYASEIDFYASYIANSGSLSAATIYLHEPYGSYADDPTYGIVNSGSISGLNLVISTDDTDEQITNLGVITAAGGKSTISSLLRDSTLFDNEDLISATGGEVLTLGVSGENNGTISVGGAGSRIVFAGGSLGGAGQMEIDGGGTLEVESGTLSDGVTFADGAVGTLQIDGPGLFSGTISGLAPGDVIDFADATVTSASVSGTALTVTYEGGATEDYTLAAALPAGEGLQVQPDGEGGTEIVVTNGTAPPPPPFTWVDGTSGDWGTASNWLAQRSSGRSRHRLDQQDWDGDGDGLVGRGGEGADAR